MMMIALLLIYLSFRYMREKGSTGVEGVPAAIGGLFLARSTQEDPPMISMPNKIPLEVSA